MSVNIIDRYEILETTIPSYMNFPYMLWDYHTDEPLCFFYDENKANIVKDIMNKKFMDI